MSHIYKQIDEYLRYLSLIRGVAGTTLQQKQTILLYFTKITKIPRIEDLTNDVYNNWIKYLQERQLKPGSINAYTSIILTMVNYFKDNQLKIPLNTTLIKKAKIKKAQRVFYSRTDIERVVKMADFETGLMIKILFETGMRITELVRLRIDNIQNRRISFIGKGSKPREVYITSETMELLQRYIALYSIVGFLWGIYNDRPTYNGEPPTTNTIRNNLKKAFKKAGFEDFYPHALRHSFATDLQLRGASVAEIKEMMGHENIATTERYLHGFDGRLKELFDKYR